ncbi:MAG: FHA domain-containing protein, partial [Clostridia bacterium]|nr:FHA domain-containing protein [Clostridia bacterium]
MGDLIVSLGAILVFALRLILPLLSILFIFGVVKDLFKKQGKITLAKLVTANGLDFDIQSVESIIGRSKLCDVVLNIPSISRRHAVITYSDDYGFKISSVFGSEIFVNDTPIDEYAYFDFGDIIEIGGLQLKLTPCEMVDISSSSKPQKRGVATAILLTVIQAIMFLEIMIHFMPEIKIYIPIAFGGLILVEWVYFLIHRFKNNINIEILGFFLTTVGFSVAASYSPDNMLKQIITAGVGLFAFIILQFVYKNMELVMKLRYFVAGVAVL